MKRFLVMILMLAMVMSLAGCGDDSSASSTPVENQQEETVDTSDTQDEEPVPSESEQPSTSKPEEIVTTELSGIIALIARKDSNKTYFESEVVCINPTTGEQTVIATYPYVEDTSSMVRLVGDSTFYRYSTSREAFSSDYTKLAATIWVGNSLCAGWIDKDGKVFSVTEALGQLPTGDFADPCTYGVVGFIDDYFVYSEGEGLSAKYYGVPVDNIQANAVFELTTDMTDIIPQCIQTHISNFPKKYHNGNTLIASWGKGDNSHPSDVLDEEHFIIGSSIVNAVSGEETVYIPGTSRTNWSGTVDPTGEQIAFLSMSSANDNETGLYITSSSGGEPVKVPCSLPASVYSWDTGAIGGIVTGEGYTNLNVVMCQIIGWK